MKYTELTKNEAEFLFERKTNEDISFVARLIKFLTIGG